MERNNINIDRAIDARILDQGFQVYSFFWFPNNAKKELKLLKKLRADYTRKKNKIIISDYKIPLSQVINLRNKCLMI